MPSAIEPISTAVVRLADIRQRPLSVDELLDVIRDPAAGGTCVFIGSVRDLDDARAVTALTYSAHPSAKEQLVQVCDQVATRHDVIAIAAVHRVDDLLIGDVAVVVAVSAAHRSAAFAAARDLIDTLKSSVPIWKKQIFADGSQQWVGLP